MNIVIIEDEQVLAEDLAESILDILKGQVSIVQLHTVAESIAYFRAHTQPDLIFSDIQLGDGLSFEIFVAVPMSVPVIFCTAYNEYALDAFRANGIDYILKPFTIDTLEKALQKYNQFKNLFLETKVVHYEALLQTLTNHNSAKASSILVYYQDKILPIKLEDIALFYVQNELTHLLTSAGKAYYPNKKLDELERMAGSQFFRANRQFLVSRKAIVDASSFFNRKLLLNLAISFPEKITVSKEKVPVFLDWLSQAE